MAASIQNSENCSKQKLLCVLGRENAPNRSPMKDDHLVQTIIGETGSISMRLSSLGGSYPGDSEGKNQYDRSSSPEEEADLEFLPENGSTSPMESSSTYEDASHESGSSSEEQDLSYGDGAGNTSDDDYGDDFIVSKYMQSKISRQDEARCGVWKVKKAEAPGVDDGKEIPNREARETSGPSTSERLPPLKLTLKKSLQGSPELPVMKKKHKTKCIPKEPKDPEKKRGPGRPPSNNPPSTSTRQRLMNLFKKKYFKDRKRWARSKSSYTMPPTIRSIAKP